MQDLTRTQLRQRGYTVTAEKTGAQYPNACSVGLGWSFVLRRNGEVINNWREHALAWAWAQRLENVCRPA